MPMKEKCKYTYINYCFKPLLIAKYNFKVSLYAYAITIL